MRNRAARRRNPGQWWQIVATARDVERVDVVDGPAVFVRGEAEGVTVLQLPPEVEQMSGAAHGAYMQAVQEALKAAGINAALIVPRGVDFVSLRPVEPEKARALEANYHLANRKHEDPEPSEVH